MLADNIGGAALHLLIDTADILTEEAYRDQLKAAKEHNRRHYRGPTGRQACLDPD